LTIDDASTGLAPLPSRHPSIAAQHIMHQLPSAILPPAPEVLIDKLPWGKVMGQQTPRTATPKDTEDGIENFAPGIFLSPPAGFGGGN